MIKFWSQIIISPVLYLTSVKTLICHLLSHQQFILFLIVSNISIAIHQASKPKKYRGKKPQNKPSPEPETETDFQVRCTDMEGYTFDLGTRVSDKFARKMK